jgi:hypothetical protein
MTICPCTLLRIHEDEIFGFLLAIDHSHSTRCNSQSYPLARITFVCCKPSAYGITDVELQKSKSKDCFQILRMVFPSMGLSLPNSYSEPSLDGLALGAPRIHRDSALLRDIDLLLLGGSVASTTCMGIERSGMLKWRCRFRDLDAGKGGVLAHDRG